MKSKFKLINNNLTSNNQRIKLINILFKANECNSRGPLTKKYLKKKLKQFKKKKE